jgi:hypothetical protein
MVNERVSTGSTAAEAIAWVARECELRSEAVEQLRKAVEQPAVRGRLETAVDADRRRKENAGA